jgi:hypothetical protein
MVRRMQRELERRLLDRRKGPERRRQGGAPSHAGGTRPDGNHLHPRIERVAGVPSLDAGTQAANPAVVRRAIFALVGVVLIAGAFGIGYYVGSHAEDRHVPNLLGLGTEDGGQAAARRELATVGLRVGKAGRMLCTSDENGLVVQQSPPAGTVVPKGATVNIAIGDDGTHLIGLFPSGSVKSCLPGTQQPAG